MTQFDAVSAAGELVAFIHGAVTRAGFSRAVIALSGGVDSATSYALATRALGVENVHAALLPYGSLSEKGLADARLMAKSVGAPEGNVHVIDIQSPVDAFLALDPGMDALRKGNIMARCRMIVLYDRARKHDALVVGTENRSEHLLGYFTRFGDEASDIEPLRGLYKTQVYALARHLGVVEPILTKAPTAGLWEGQTDEGEFGFSYAEADAIMAMMYDEGKSLDEVAQAGYKYETIEAISAWVAGKAYKHHLPITAGSA
jgi:NAD+ synthase